MVLIVFLEFHVYNRFGGCRNIAIILLCLHDLDHTLVAFDKVFKDLSWGTGSDETADCMSPDDWEAMAVHFLSSAITGSAKGGPCKVLHLKKSHDFLGVLWTIGWSSTEVVDNLSPIDWMHSLFSAV